MCPESVQTRGHFSRIWTPEEKNSEVGSFERTRVTNLIINLRVLDDENLAAGRSDENFFELFLKNFHPAFKTSRKLSSQIKLTRHRTLSRSLRFGCAFLFSPRAMWKIVEPR